MVKTPIPSAQTLQERKTSRLGELESAGGEAGKREGPGNHAVPLAGRRALCELLQLWQLLNSGEMAPKLLRCGGCFQVPR